MRKRRIIKRAFCVITLTIIVNCIPGITVIAQDKKEEIPTPNVVRSIATYGYGAVVGGTSGSVKGAPFSGEMVSENIQILIDGNRIVNRSSTLMYRDSEGRTRNEFSFKPLFLGGANVEHKSISIFDPVNGVSYMLDPQTRIAQKQMIHKPVANQFNTLQSLAVQGGASATPPMALAIRQPGQVLSIRYAKGMKLKTVISSLVRELGLNVVFDDSLKDAQLMEEIDLQNVTLAKALEIILKNNSCSFEKVDDRTIRVGGENPAGNQESFESFYINSIQSRKVSSPLLSLPGKSEPLGLQMIEGVEAEGTRSIQIIPVGAMGNEGPIEVVHENWYSPELQMSVMTKTSDPRSGESTMRLTSLSRSEPDPSLFQIPSDYTIREIETQGLILRRVEPAKK
jgi:hypothetical protein